VPNAPTIGTATDVGTSRAYNNGAATVTFTAPTWTGGLPITGYTVTSNPGGFTATGAASPLTVAGLASSTAYTFTARATNAVGQSSASAASNSITATTVPQAPTIGTATDGGTGSTVSVAFTAGANGGKAVTTYTATSSPGGLTGTSASSPITVSGLTAGTAYTFTVTATNANGTSTASAASNSVTPAVPSSYDSIASTTFTSPTYIAQFNSIPSTYKHLQIRYRDNDNSASFILLQLNNDTGTNYAWHYIQGNGGVVSADNNSLLSYIRAGEIGGTSLNPTVGIIDIHDYSSTSKRKTIRHINGNDNNGSGIIQLGSGLWTGTSAVSSITLQFADPTGSCTVSLYGIKG
jgi:hypothetical protein